MGDDLLLKRLLKRERLGVGHAAKVADDEFCRVWRSVHGYTVYTPRMPVIHPTAVVEGEVHLGEDVEVGPHCVITGPVTMGAGTRLIAAVHLHGPTTVGEGNLLYPNVCLGFAPQSISYDAAHPGRGLVIGDHNTLREGVTMHRAMTDAGPTRVGSHNYFMACAHVGHDCRVGDHGVFANGANLAGHVHVADRVTLGGGANVHQWVHLGRGSMISGSAGATMDVIPFGLVTAISLCANVNIVGMRRSGMSRADIDLVRRVHRTICRRGLTKASAIDALRAEPAHPLLAEFIEFLETSKRGVCIGKARQRRVPLETTLADPPSC